MGTATSPASAGENWQPVNSADLALKDNAASPGDHAMILYRDESLDDIAATISEYKRVKIFDDQGKDYANVEIPYGTHDSIKDLHARTILPDGTISEFTGKTFDRILAKSGGEHVRGRTFTLTGVQPGCIIEYRFTIQLETGYYYESTWDVQDDLFTRDAIFSIRPYSGATLYTRVSHLPQNVRPEKQKDGTYGLELHNVAALITEEHMPPEDSIRGRIQFFYRDRTIQSTADFWKTTGKQWNDVLDKFVSAHKDELQQEVSKLVSPGDSDEVKLAKCYERAQKVRDLSIEPSKTDEEKKRDKLKTNNNAADVLKNNYGTYRDINFLFVALARAAGFNATEVYVAPRHREFFVPDLQEPKQLSADVVNVKLASANLYLDPACLECPYSLLPWYETGADGLRVDRDGGQMVSTPPSKPADAIYSRHADLQLSPSGDLHGTLDVDYQGLWAIQERSAGRNEDQTLHEKMLSDEILDGLPPGSHFKLSETTGWDRNSGPLHARGDIEVAGAVVAAGHRLLLTAGVLQAGLKPIFQRQERIYPIYYRFPFQLTDDVVVHFPAGMQADSAPTSTSMPAGAATYEFKVVPASDGLHFTRALSIDGFMFPVSAYSALRDFYAKAQKDDGRQIVLKTAAK